MVRLVIIAAVVPLLGCARCGAEGAGADADEAAAGANAPAADVARGRAPVAAPGVETGEGDLDAAVAGEIEVRPGPDDCWSPGDVVELQLEPRGFPVKGLKFEGPACDAALEAAVARGDFAVVRALIEQVRIPDHWPARSPRCRTAGMGTLLHLAAASGSAQLTEYLVSKGAGVRGCDLEGATPLHLAAASLDLPVARLLVDKGALVDAVDLEGNRPLHRCFDNPAFRPLPPALDPERLDVARRLARLLIASGARVERRRRSGETAADLAPTDDLRALLRAPAK
jgi:hypothetical protein